MRALVTCAVLVLGSTVPFFPRRMTIPQFSRRSLRSSSCGTKLKSADLKALDSILDDAILLVNDDGSVQTKSEFLASVKTTAAQPTAQQQQVSPESLNVHVHGNVAIATGVMRVKGVENGKSYTRRERFVDTWLLKGSKWVCIGTNATPVLH